MRQDLDVAAMALVLSAPPQVGAVRSAHRDAVGVDERAVEVQVVVGGGRADRVVGGQLAHADVVQEPVQREHRVLERAERPSARARAEHTSPQVAQSRYKSTVSRRASSTQVNVTGSSAMIGGNENPRCEGDP